MPDELLAGATTAADFLAGLGAGAGFDSQHLETTMRSASLPCPSSTDHCNYDWSRGDTRGSQNDIGVVDGRHLYQLSR